MNESKPKGVCDLEISAELIWRNIRSIAEFGGYSMSEILCEYLQNANDATPVGHETSFRARFETEVYEFEHHGGEWTRSQLDRVFLPGGSTKNLGDGSIGHMGRGSVSALCYSDIAVLTAPTSSAAVKVTLDLAARTRTSTETKDTKSTKFEFRAARLKDYIRECNDLISIGPSDLPWKLGLPFLSRIREITIEVVFAITITITLRKISVSGISIETRRQNKREENLVEYRTEIVPLDGHNPFILAVPFRTPGVNLPRLYRVLPLSGTEAIPLRILVSGDFPYDLLRRSRGWRVRASETHLSVFNAYVESVVAMVIREQDPENSHLRLFDHLSAPLASARGWRRLGFEICEYLRTHSDFRIWINGVSRTLDQIRLPELNYRGDRLCGLSTSDLTILSLDTAVTWPSFMSHDTTSVLQHGFGVTGWSLEEVIARVAKIADSATTERALLLLFESVRTLAAKTRREIMERLLGQTYSAWNEQPLRRALSVQPTNPILKGKADSQCALSSKFRLELERASRSLSPTEYPYARAERIAVAEATEGIHRKFLAVLWEISDLPEKNQDSKEILEDCARRLWPRAVLVPNADVYAAVVSLVGPSNVILLCQEGDLDEFTPSRRRNTIDRLEALCECDRNVGLFAKRFRRCVQTPGSFNEEQQLALCQLRIEWSRNWRRSCGAVVLRSLRRKLYQAEDGTNSLSQNLYWDGSELAGVLPIRRLYPSVRNRFSAHAVSLCRAFGFRLKPTVSLEDLERAWKEYPSEGGWQDRSRLAAFLRQRSWPDSSLHVFPADLRYYRLSDTAVVANEAESWLIRRIGGLGIAQKEEAKAFGVERFKGYAVEVLTRRFESMALNEPKSLVHIRFEFCAKFPFEERLLLLLDEFISNAASALWARDRSLLMGSGEIIALGEMEPAYGKMLSILVESGYRPGSALIDSSGWVLQSVQLATGEFLARQVIHLRNYFERNRNPRAIALAERCRQCMDELIQKGDRMVWISALTAELMEELAHVTAQPDWKLPLAPPTSSPSKSLEEASVFSSALIEFLTMPVGFVFDLIDIFRPESELPGSHRKTRFGDILKLIAAFAIYSIVLPPLLRILPSDRRLWVAVGILFTLNTCASIVNQIVSSVREKPYFHSLSALIKATVFGGVLLIAMKSIESLYPVIEPFSMKVAEEFCLIACIVCTVTHLTIGSSYRQVRLLLTTMGLILLLGIATRFGLNWSKTGDTISEEHNRDFIRFGIGSSNGSTPRVLLPPSDNARLSVSVASTPESETASPLPSSDALSDLVRRTRANLDAFDRNYSLLFRRDKPLFKASEYREWLDAIVPPGIIKQEAQPSRPEMKR